MITKKELYNSLKQSIESEGDNSVRFEIDGEIVFFTEIDHGRKIKIKLSKTNEKENKLSNDGKSDQATSDNKDSETPSKRKSKG